MESKFFSSPPKVGSAKRGFSDELQESPTAKRAKRAKHGKKHRSKEPKEPKDVAMKDSDGYTEHQDWVSFDSSPATGSPIARKQTPIKPPATFPLKEAHKAHVLKSAEKAKVEQKTETATNGAKVSKDTKNGTKDNTAQEDKNSNSKAEANTRKTRAERDLKKGAKLPVNNGKPASQTVAGPSKTILEQCPVKFRELTPLNSTPPRAPVDYTFKSFPNPPSLFPSPKKEQPDDKPKSQTANKPPVPVDDTPIPMQLDTAESPIPAAAFAAPAGTKTLKAINKHLKSLEAKLNTGTKQTDQVTTDIQSLRSDITRLHERLDRDELRAAIRHEILFNALVKVSTDIGVLNGQVQAIQQQQQQQDGHIHGQDGIDGENTPSIKGENGTTPRANTTAAGAGRDKDKDKDKDTGKDKDKRPKVKLNKSIAMQQSRKTLEQCLRIYTEDLNRSDDREEVAILGGLCVQYAGDLFKTLG